MIEKRKNIIRVLKKERKRYRWEREESDRIFLRDGDVYDD